MGVSPFSLRCAVVIVLLMSCAQAQESKSREYPTPEVREEQAVVVSGVEETWQLRWKGSPKPVCGANEVYMAMTCPCSGFAYGEAGDLYLLRLRNGGEIDRLHLTPFFEEQFQNEGDLAIVQRWQFDYDRDKDDGEDLTPTVAKRTVVRAMDLADYDHDGKATEFYLQTESQPCGKSFGIVIGISATNPRLHVFGTASHPGKPQYLFRHEWNALRDASGPTEVLDWECGDHASDVRTTLNLNWTREGIGGVLRTYECSAGGEPGKLLSEEPL